MKIATWNVNSIRSRLDHVIQWCKDAQPDVLLLQEIKVITEGFPYEAFMEIGYQSAVHGQKTYNGVAILSKYSIEDITTEFDPSHTDARYIEAVIDGWLRVASVYVPNGQSIDSEKYPYKLDFLTKLEKHLEKTLEHNEVFVIGGDYNIAPWDEDAHDPEKYKGNVPVSQAERNAYRRILNLGLTDATRIKYPYDSHENPSLFSWWDYRAGSFEKDHGLRIDHLLLSPEAVDKMKDTGIDRTPRGWEKPSDHTPVWLTLEK